MSYACSLSVFQIYDFMIFPYLSGVAYIFVYLYIIIYIKNLVSLPPKLNNPSYYIGKSGLVG